MTARPVVCPAARPLAGPPIGGPSCVCAIMLREGDKQDSVTEGRDQAHVTSQHDPSTYFGLCTGEQLPIGSDEDLARRMASGEQLPRTHTICPIWQEEKNRIAAERDGKAWGGGPERYRPPESTEDLLSRIEV